MLGGVGGDDCALDGNLALLLFLAASCFAGTLALGVVWAAKRL